MEADLLWVRLAQENIRRGLNRGPRCRTQILDPSRGAFIGEHLERGLPILQDLEKGLYEGRNSLCFESDGAKLLAHLTVGNCSFFFAMRNASCLNRLLVLRGS